jgi:hypothetical protein
MNSDDKSDSNKNQNSQFKKKFFKDLDDDFDSFFEDSHGNNMKFFGFPPEILEQIEKIMSSLENFEDSSEEFKDDFFKESEVFKRYSDFKSARKDTDLDDQIYAEQLDALLKRISPDFKEVLPEEKASTPKKKLRLTDEQKIMDMIHGTFKEEVFTPRPRAKKLPPARKTPHFNFDGTPIPPHASRTWGRTVISIRRPDGTFETRKTERNSDGSVVTTITKTERDGTQSTETFNSGNKKHQQDIQVQPPTQATIDETEYNPEKNLRIFNGYKIPILW